MRKLVSIMLALIIAISTNGAWATPPADSKVTVDFVNQSPEKILKEIGRQSGLNIVYKSEDVKKWGKMTLKATDETAESLINRIAQKVGEEYSIKNNIVVFGKKQGKIDALVHGIVVDEQGEPLPGATVVIVGSNTGTSTNIDGEFVIRVDAESPVLQVTYVGMNAATCALNRQNVNENLKIVLQSNAAVMDEVVVTGYQNIKRENATGSYTILNSEELEKRYSSNLMSNLEGNMAGLVVKNRNSTLGSEESHIVIRGEGSFDASTAPLVVVDGLPIEGGMGSVNLYDIDNITVLKDASAASIYGARASNGVIVITTKRANRERLQVDFNADLSITEKINYNKAGWANAAQLIQLERYNWADMVANDQSSLSSLIADYNRGATIPSPVTELFIKNHLGELSEAEMNSTLNSWANNDYRREFQNLRERNRVDQRYNLSLRNQGRVLSSSIVFNYSRSNKGLVKEYDNTLSFRYKGDIKVCKWMDLSVSANVINTRSRSNIYEYSLDGVNARRPYETMYNADGTPFRFKGDVNLNNEAFNHPEYELKDHTFSPIDETGLNQTKDRYTNIRTYIHTNFRLPVKGWTASAQFQYEDISTSTRTLYEGESYFVRNLFNRATTNDIGITWVTVPYDQWDMDKWDGDFDHIYMNPVEQNVLKHRLPDGAILQHSDLHGAYYTFRAQTNYSREFAGKHNVDVLAGFEYRENHSTGKYDTLLGYDHQTQTNQNLFADWAFLKGWGSSGVLGSQYTLSGVPMSFGTNEVLHRFYSIYFTGNYVYDARYSVFGSYRVDKTDLFGTDPKYRGRPLWSVGASWNAHNEAFMREITWLNALKLRASYGLTGNIDSSATSVMVANIGTNGLNGNGQGTVTAPPNDQLRWEKTATWNFGLDFALLGYRLNGTLDYYRKSGSDLFCDVVLDATTGWSSQRLNAGEMINNGFELTLNGRILQQRSRRDVGVSLSGNFAINHNKVTKVYEKPVTGNDFRTFRLKEGYPLGTTMGIDYAGFQEIDGMIYGTWRDHEGEIHNTSLSNADFTQDDCIYVGTTTPKWSGGFTPEVKWNGFSLSGMFGFYGGHVMNCSPQIWDTYYGSSAGYSGSTPASALNYWEGDKEALPNGYRTKYLNRNTQTIGASDYRNYESANYLKLRNLVLSYDFDRSICKKIGLTDLRLRVQMDNVCTWVKNSRGWDPEGTTLTNGVRQRSPRNYTMSLFISL